MTRQTIIIWATAILLVVVAVVLSGCTTALSCEDRSREQLARCNADCGEGVGSELCKTGCTNEHNQRLDQCREQTY